MPGVSITTSARSGPSTPLPAASGQFFIVGVFERGPVAATVIRSIADLRQVYGGRVSYSDAYDQLVTFFAEGGVQAQVVRVVGDAASSGTLSLNDRATTPIPTLKVDAANAGAWSSNLTVEVKDGSNTDTFRLVVRLAGEVVEDYNNLASPADAATRTTGSNYIKVTNLGSASAAPTNNPAVKEATALSAGTDDRAAVVAADYVDALARFPRELGDGAVAVPGQDNATVRNGLIEHAKNNRRIALLCASKDDTVSGLVSTAAGLNSEYAGLFAPWVVVPTEGTGTKVISPEGYVAAVRSRAHLQEGPWRAPAGAISVASHVLDVYQTFSGTESETLDDAKVSVVRKIANTVRLYGWRSLSNNSDNWAYLKDRDLVNRIANEAEARLEQFVFEPIDGKGQFLAVVNAELVGILEPIAAANGLFGTYNDAGDEIDPGYLVDTSIAVNPVSSLAQNRVNAIISLRVSPTAAYINLAITKVNLMGALG